MYLWDGDQNHGTDYAKQMGASGMKMYTFRQALLWTSLAAICAWAEPVVAQYDNIVRVRLFDLASPTEVRISGSEGAVRVYAADFEDEITRLERSETAVVRRSGAQLHIRIGDIGIFANSIRVEPDPGAQTVIGVDGGSAAMKPRQYEGRVRISRDESGQDLRVINEIDLEDYVAAVVSTEYGFDDLEGSKAMAVIIRTYTLAVMNKYGGEYDHVDHTLSQVYRGTDRITPTIREAVRRTEGQVLSHDGSLIESVYFSDSGGHTADNETVWISKPLPYLRGKPDPYGSASPYAQWKSRISRPRLLSALSAEYGNVKGFAIGDRANDGRVRSVDLLMAAGGRRSIRSNEFRILVLKHFGANSLRSTMFTARRDGDEYVFEGKGNGHGVGLSQWGAHELAQRGTPYEEILDFYYTDVHLVSLDNLGSAAERPRASAEPQEDPPQSPARIGW